MKIPRCTYRLQFHSQFNFQEAQKILGYLSGLGISDIYASPIFKAQKGSLHGYDIVDPTQINPQLGGKDEFDSLVTRSRENQLGWLQDIVPNHMAFNSENRLLTDILENGPRSKYYKLFDIQWDHPYEHLKGKLLAPILGDLYGRCLDRGEIKLNFDEDGFNIRFYEWKLPLKIESYTKVLAGNLTWLEGKIQRDEQDYIQFLEVSQRFKSLGEIVDSSQHYNQLALLKAQLWKLYISNQIIKGYVDSLVVDYNGTPGDTHSLNKLDDLLSEQYFKLSFWKVGNEELNYRRFFTINGLLSVRVEDHEIFEYTHNFLFQLIKSGQITGVRVDHIDGLYDPVAYLNKLRQRETELYIVVEKILDTHEALPSIMPVQGTTGYDFMNVVNGVFIDKSHEKAIDRLYQSFSGQNTSFRKFVSDKKRLFMGQQMAGDIDNLAHLLKQVINGDRYGKDMTMYALRRAIVEIMAQFPVYRAYMGEGEFGEKDKLHIKEAVALAENKNPGLFNELEFISKILLLEFAPDLAPKKKEAYHNFTRKFQQFSGALMAKGAEDTAFYIYNRFISINEVGSDPSVFGISPKDFHEFMANRQNKWPATLNATATHDTKRGEDVRARLNVLSEVPKQWQQQVNSWSRSNNLKKKMINGVEAPDRNDEYFIYQTLVGAYPLHENEQESFVKRMKDYMLKALREAKTHTTWLRQDAGYEEACLNFIHEILKPAPSNLFLKSFIQFHQKIVAYGMVNSFAQVLLKMTCPGVPDFYQGTELWDLSLVDPDNRRPVDYLRRMDLLRDIKKRNNSDFFKKMKDDDKDGKVKMFLIAKILQLRSQYPDLFLKGDYLPLEIKGELSSYALAFARKYGDLWGITIVPRFSKKFSEGKYHWRKIHVSLPDNAPSVWKNVITDEKLKAKGDVPLHEIFGHFPVAFLLSA